MGPTAPAGSVGWELEEPVSKQIVNLFNLFNLKIHQNKHEDFVEKLTHNTNEKLRLEKLINDSHIQLNEKNSENQELILKESLQEKEQAEKNLIKAREDLLTKETNLKNLESKRLEKQHSLNPLTEKVQESKILFHSTLKKDG